MSADRVVCAPLAADIVAHARGPPASHGAGWSCSIVNMSLEFVRSVLFRTVAVIVIVVLACRPCEGGARERHTLWRTQKRCAVHADSSLRSPPPTQVQTHNNRHSAMATAIIRVTVGHWLSVLRCRCGARLTEACGVCAPLVRPNSSQLKDGTSHEDVGCGSSDRQPSRAAAIENAKKVGCLCARVRFACGAARSDA